MKPVEFLKLLESKFKKIELELSIQEYEDKLIALIFDNGFKDGFMHRTVVGSIFFENEKFSCKINLYHFGDVLTLFAIIPNSDFPVAVSLNEESDTKIIK